MAVAIIRAIDRHFELDLSDDDVNNLAYQCECVAHGTPSGIDNTVATFGQPLVYRRGDPPEIHSLQFPEPVTFVIGNNANQPLLGDLAMDSGGFSMNVSSHDDLIGRILWCWKVWSAKHWPNSTRLWKKSICPNWQPTIATKDCWSAF